MHAFEEAITYLQSLGKQIENFLPKAIIIDSLMFHPDAIIPIANAYRKYYNLPLIAIPEEA